MRNPHIAPTVNKRMPCRLAILALFLSTPAFAANAALAHIQKIYLSVDNSTPRATSLRMHLTPELRKVKVAIVDKQSEADAALTIDWPLWSEGGSGVISAELKDAGGKTIWTMDLKTGSRQPMRTSADYSKEFQRLAVHLRDDIKAAQK